MKPSVKNINKLAPAWFRKLKKATILLTDATIVILLGIGFTDKSLILLILRIAVPALFNSVEIFLSDETDA